MMAICACVAIIISAFNIFITTGLVGNLSADQSAMIELESQLEGLLSADQAVGIFSAVMYAALILIVIFNVMKIIVGIVGFRKAETGTTYFIAWGIVLLVFGVLSLGGLFSLLGICNLLGALWLRFSSSSEEVRIEARGALIWLAFCLRVSRGLFLQAS